LRDDWFIITNENYSTKTMTEIDLQQLLFCMFANLKYAFDKMLYVLKLLRMWRNTAEICNFSHKQKTEHMRRILPAIYIAIAFCMLSEKSSAQILIQSRSKLSK
jgi:hypothetical protein